MSQGRIQSAGAGKRFSPLPFEEFNDRRVVKILVLGPLSRILSTALFMQRDLHFSQTTRRQPAPLLLHFREAQRDATNPELSDGPPSPLFSLAPDWVFHAAVIAFGAVGSYPTFSPLPRGCPRGGIFSVTLSVKAP